MITNISVFGAMFALIYIIARLLVMEAREKNKSLASETKTKAQMRAAKIGMPPAQPHNFTNQRKVR